METKHEDTHINESILSEEILEDQKKNRIDHMTYLPGMEDIGSEILDQVVTAMEAYDYNTYTAEDVKRALAHAERTPEDFQALLSPAALPFLEEIAQAAQIETRKHFGNSVICSHQSISQIIARTIAFTVVLIAITKSTVHS